jgi:carbon storage regulator
MLVLSRKPGESIQIGSNITLTVVEVRGNRIKLGIEAPRSVEVVRGELEPRSSAFAPFESSAVDAGSIDFAIIAD